MRFPRRSPKTTLVNRSSILDSDSVQSEQAGKAASVLSALNLLGTAQVQASMSLQERARQSARAELVADEQNELVAAEELAMNELSVADLMSLMRDTGSLRSFHKEIERRVHQARSRVSGDAFDRILKVAIACALAEDDEAKWKELMEASDGFAEGDIAIYRTTAIYHLFRTLSDHPDRFRAGFVRFAKRPSTDARRNEACTRLWALLNDEREVVRALSDVAPSAEGPSKKVLMAWGSYLAKKHPGASIVPEAQEIIAALKHDLASVIVSFGKRGWDAPTSLSFVTVGLSWAKAGFPLIVPTHKLAASFMATEVSTEVADDLRLPWPCFMVHLPNGLFGTVEGRFAELSFIGLCAEGMRMFFAPAGDVYDSGTIRAVDMTTLVTLASGERHPIIDERFTPIEARIIAMCARMLVNVCIEMDSPTEREGVQRAQATSAKRAKPRQEPAVWTYELRRPIKVDCREWVGRYIAQGGKSPAVQSLVRGHRKRQPHGKGMLLRKWIHVEPYWRGPEDAPVIVRSHRMGEEES